MPVYDTNRTTATVATGKELYEDKGGATTKKVATETLVIGECEDLVLTAAGVVS